MLLLLGQTIETHLMIVEATVAPIIPANALDCRIGQSGGKERRPEPASSNGGSSNTSKRRGYIRLIPSRARAYRRAIGSFLDSFHTFAFQVGVKGSVAGDVERNARENEQKGVCDKGSGRLGKAKRTSEILAKKMLRSVVRHGKTGGNSDNMLRASSPERTIDFATKKGVEVSVIHLKEKAAV